MDSFGATIYIGDYVFQTSLRLTKPLSRTTCVTRSSKASHESTEHPPYMSAGYNLQFAEVIACAITIFGTGR
jgi:hypothetical protein